MIVAFLALLSVVRISTAQNQEGKLVDRLLRPNMSLANSAQNKQFGTATSSVGKRAPSREFHLPPKPSPKAFASERTFSPRQYAARHFRAGDSAANVASKTQLTKNDTVSLEPAPATSRVAPEDGRTVPSVSFPGERPFLVQGKSQKALSAQNKPLTIEQVRELLNKNK